MVDLAAVLSQYDRSAHIAACPCKLCVTFDVLLAQSEGLRTDLWRDLPGYVTTQRNRDLNWDLEPGHCILCGGFTPRSSTVMEHYERKRWNEKEIAGKWYTSLLLHKAGWQIGSYRAFLQKGRQATQLWACNFMDLSPLPCIGIASKEHDEWLEIRLGFTDLIIETYEQRTNRRWEEHRRVRETARSTGPEVQGAVSLAR